MNSLRPGFTHHSYTIPNPRRTAAVIGHRSGQLSRLPARGLPRSAGFDRPRSASRTGRRDHAHPEKGIEHEKRYLASLKARGLAVVEIAPEGFDLVERSALARRTMRAGAAVIYQAALLAPPWHGYADFLERVAEPSSFGPWGYQAVDTKLGGRAKPEHAIQVAAYSKLLGIEQGRAPRRHTRTSCPRRQPAGVAAGLRFRPLSRRRTAAAGGVREPAAAVVGRGTVRPLPDLPVAGPVRGPNGKPAIT